MSRAFGGWVENVHKNLSEISTAGSQIQVNDQFAVNELLGDKGRHILDRVISLVEDFSAKQNWPLIRIEISLIKDEEVQNWQYILLRLIFNSDFESADNYLHDFYHRLDDLADSMNDEHIFRRMFFFDVGTIV